MKKLKALLPGILLLIQIFVTAKISAQPNPNGIDPYSNYSCYVEMYHDQQLLGNGTGFFLSIGPKIYFITNNHVVGGVFYLNEYRRLHGVDAPENAIPNRLEIKVHTPEVSMTTKMVLTIRNGNIPRYRTFHQKSNPADLMDVATISITRAEHMQMVHPLLSSFTELSENKNLQLTPGQDMFVVGYPFNYGQISNYPIWKRGTIASDPNVPNSDYFLIDATTRPGMSGSPVVFRGNSFITKTGFEMGPSQTFLVGIFSAQDNMSELGYVWKITSVLDELLKFPDL